MDGGEPERFSSPYYNVFHNRLRSTRLVNRSFIRLHAKFYNAENPRVSNTRISYRRREVYHASGTIESREFSVMSLTDSMEEIKNDVKYELEKNAVITRCEQIENFISNIDADNSTLKKIFAVFLNEASELFEKFDIDTDKRRTALTGEDRGLTAGSLPPPPPTESGEGRNDDVIRGLTSDSNNNNNDNDGRRGSEHSGSNNSSNNNNNNNNKDGPGGLALVDDSEKFDYGESFTFESSSHDPASGVDRAAPAVGGRPEEPAASSDTDHPPVLSEGYVPVPSAALQFEDEAKKSLAIRITRKTRNPAKKTFKKAQRGKKYSAGRKTLRKGSKSRYR